MIETMKRTQKWAFGLHGIPALMANASAIAVMMIMFWRMEVNQEARYDQNRTDYRDDIKQFWSEHRALSKEISAAIESNARAVNQMTDSMHSTLAQMHDDHLRIIQRMPRPPRPADDDHEAKAKQAGGKGSGRP